jgi:hypothetical protein
MKWMVYPFHADINVLTFERPILFKVTKIVPSLIGIFSLEILGKINSEYSFNFSVQRASISSLFGFPYKQYQF